MAITQAGYTIDANAINNRAGALATQWRDLVVATQQFEADLAGWADADMVALPGSPALTEPAVTLIKSAFTQLAALCSIATGATAGQTTANNYLFFSDQLTGTF